MMMMMQVEDRFLTDYLAFSYFNKQETYTGQIDLVGKFKTGSVSHTLVAGFDFEHGVLKSAFYSNPVDLPCLDIFNPNYDVPLPVIPTGPLVDNQITRSYGVYLQDQIAFSDNLKMLKGRHES